MPTKTTTTTKTTTAGVAAAEAVARALRQPVESNDCRAINPARYEADVVAATLLVLKYLRDSPFCAYVMARAFGRVIGTLTAGHILSEPECSHSQAWHFAEVLEQVREGFDRGVRVHDRIMRGEPIAERGLNNAKDRASVTALNSGHIAPPAHARPTGSE